MDQPIACLLFSSNSIQWRLSHMVLRNRLLRSMNFCKKCGETFLFWTKVADWLTKPCYHPLIRTISGIKRALCYFGQPSFTLVRDVRQQTKAILSWGARELLNRSANLLEATVCAGESPCCGEILSFTRTGSVIVGTENQSSSLMAQRLNSTRHTSDETKKRISEPNTLDLESRIF